MARLIKTLSPKEPKEEKVFSSALHNLLKNSTHYNDVIPQENIISSGSLILDSEARVRSGMIVRLVGKGSEVGKSSQGFVFLEKYMETMPNSKAFFVKSEGRGLSLDKLKKAGLKFVFNKEEWVTGTVFVYCGNTAEKVFAGLVEILHESHREGTHIAWMIDSLDGLILHDDLAKGMDNNGMIAGVPKLTKLLFRHLALPNAHYDALGIITSQASTQIKIDQYTPNAANQGGSSGGMSQQHQADYVFEYQQIPDGKFITEKEGKPDRLKNKIIGKFARVKVLKSADDITGNMYEIPIRRGDQYKGSKQIWSAYEVASMLIACGLVTTGGAWISFESDIIEEAKVEGLELQEKVNGMNKLYDYLEENEQIMQFLRKKILSLISNDLP
jgi:hypothetical protein